MKVKLKLEIGQENICGCKLWWRFGEGDEDRICDLGLRELFKYPKGIENLRLITSFNYKNSTSIKMKYCSSPRDLCFLDGRGRWKGLFTDGGVDSLVIKEYGENVEFWVTLFWKE